MAEPRAESVGTRPQPGKGAAASDSANLKGNLPIEPTDPKAAAATLAAARLAAFSINASAARGLSANPNPTPNPATSGLSGPGAAGGARVYAQDLRGAPLFCTGALTLALTLTTTHLSTPPHLYTGPAHSGARSHSAPHAHATWTHNVMSALTPRCMRFTHAGESSESGTKPPKPSVASRHYRFVIEKIG